MLGTSTAVFLTILCWLSYASASQFLPYQTVHPIRHSLEHLRPRQGQCPSDQHLCSGANGQAGCCDANAQCAVDSSGQVACCRNGAVCTGNAGGSAATTPRSQAGQTTPAAGSSPAANGNNGGGSTVPNAYFPYVYLPTTYPNAELCTSAFSSCRSEFSRCTSSLQSGNGVTVSGAGVGITAQPALGSISAGSICSSLSTKACYNLGLGNCPMYGTGSVSGGSFSAGNGATAPRCIQLYQVAVAVAVGVAGHAV